MAARERPPSFCSTVRFLSVFWKRLPASTPHPNDARWFCLLSAFVQVGMCAFDRIAEILLVDNVVPIKDAARLVPTDRHRHTLRDTGPNHVAHRRSPKVMEQASDVTALAIALRTTGFSYCPVACRTVISAQANCNASRYPGFAQVSDRPPVPVK